jgi:uncharacterized protein YgiM (DUF1202 family)
MLKQTLAIAAASLTVVPTMSSTVEAASTSSASSANNSEYRVNTSSLNIRSGPGLNHSVIGSLSKNAVVTVLSAENGWAKINYNNRTAYISLQYITSLKREATTTYIVNAAVLNVRSQAGMHGNIIGSLSRGQAVVSQGEQNGWLQIRYNGKTAYIKKDYTIGSSDAVKQASYKTFTPGNYRIDASALNIRSGPSTSSSIVGKVWKGEVLYATAETNGWLQVKHNGKTAYVSKAYVSSVSSTQPVQQDNFNAANQSYTATTTLNIRKGPGTGYSVLGVAQKGQTLQVLGEVSGWYKIRYGSQDAYVAKGYVKSSSNSVQPAAQSSVSQPLFIRPAAGSITSLFGMRWGTRHDGIDIAASGTVPVIAAASGKVLKSYYSSSYGNVVFITHSINNQMYTTVYAHLKNRLVKEGDIVRQGALLGYMGNTGHSYGQHLHFELHKGSWNASKSNAIDPLPYLK